jgi:signal transduction histidine kinase
VSFARSIAEALIAEAPDLGARWLTQARAVAPRADASAPAVDGAELVVLVACLLRDDPVGHDGVVRGGWEFGAAACAAGASLHYTLKELHLLTAMLMYAAERAVAAGGAAAAFGADAAGALAVGRKIHKAVALLTLSAAKGFTNAYVAELQEHYRMLRHDLRNPLGTIKSAVSFMEDDSVPAEMRNSPRYRGMIARNAKSLDVLIGSQLSDASTYVPAFAQQEVSLGDVALVVRRDLREEAVARGCPIEPDASLPTVVVDAASVELSLNLAASAALRAAAPGTPVRIALHARTAAAVTLVVGYEPAGDDEIEIAGAFDYARDLASLAGGKLWGGRGEVFLEFPLFSEPVPADASATALTATAPAAPAAPAAPPAPRA